MAIIGLQKGSGKRSRVREKSVKSQGILIWIMSGNPDLRIYVFITPAYSKVRYRGSTFFHPFVRPSVHNLCQGAYSVAVIAGSMKPCIEITLDTHFKKAP